MNTADKIERLREHCEYVMLHAGSDAWTIADLLHSKIGLTVRYAKIGVELRFEGPSIDSVLDEAWDKRPVTELTSS